MDKFMFRWYTQSLSSKLIVIALAIAGFCGACVYLIHVRFISPQIALIPRDSHSVLYEQLDTFSLVTSFGIIGVAFFVACLAIHKILQPIFGLHNHIELIMNGESPEELISTYDDEIGKLTNAINKVNQYSKNARDMANNISQGVIVELQDTPKEDALTDSLKVIHKTLYTLNERLTSHLRYARQGNFIETSAEEITQGAWKDIFQNVNILFALIRAPLEEIDAVLQKFSSGDHSQRVIGRYRGIFERISNQLNHTLAGQEDLIVSLKNARDKAIELSELKSQFLANMSHEIRTPMNGIIGLSELLLETQLSPQQREFTSMVHSSSEALLTVINDILDFSKIESGKVILCLGSLSIRKLLSDIEKLFMARIEERKINFIIYVSHDFPAQIRADSDRVRQIIINLIGNAIKFTRMHGAVIVYATVEELNGVKQASIYVSDSGIGISEENQKHIFQAFTQADASTTRNFGGTGLGLAISKNLAELMRGDITLRSRSGVGSRFLFRIPLEEVLDHLIDPSEIHYEKPEIGTISSKLRVLLAEDNLINQRLFSSLLRQAGLNPVIVANGLEAVQRVKTEEFDLIFLDIQMPIMDGVTAAKALKEGEFKNIPIVALTAHAMEGDKDRYLKAGFDIYLSKPLNRSHLMEILAKRSEEILTTNVSKKLD